jgi:hypothetical protein
MASQTQGIQQLLVAEKRAAEKVSEARKRKNRRLKQAKEEAQVKERSLITIMNLTCNCDLYDVSLNFSAVVFLSTYSNKNSLKMI